MFLSWFNSNQSEKKSDIALQPPCVATICASESEQLSEESSQAVPEDTCLPEPMNPSHSWAELAVYSAEIDQPQLPEEGIYDEGEENDSHSQYANLV